MKKAYVICLASALCFSALVGTGCGKEHIDGKAPAHDSADATLTLSGELDTQTASKQISADLFGLFLEDINYAGYALDDNMIANGSFESKSRGGNAERWTAGNGATLTVSNSDGIFQNKSDFRGINPNYAEITTGANGTLSNSGFAAVPIAVNKGSKYEFSAFIKTGEYAGNITVEVTDGSATYAKKEIRLNASNEWVKYETTLKATDTCSDKLVLKLTFGNAGTLLLDGVKLETGDSTAGFKNYLYRAIADLSPAFFRFPGGCVIEGTNDDSAYDWKNSVGAVKGETGDAVPAFEYTLNRDGKISQRKTYGEQITRTYNTDIWTRDSNYYQMEYGIGFYEYFLLCDSLGAKAIPIVNCGLSCQIQTPGGGIALSGRHGRGVEDYIQDAKDLVAFAKGDVNSSDPNEKYWAQVRANMGHPEPFEMDYIGIGNEQWEGTGQHDKYHTQYYQKFLEAFQKDENSLYRSVKPIVGNSTMFRDCEYHSATLNRQGEAQKAAIRYRNQQGSVIQKISEYGVHDQHYYMNYTDFMLGANVYDSYARPETSPDDYYEVFVGEYAANADVVRLPNEDANNKIAFTENGWITALAEAAMMTGFERNGDIVKLAAYAPMFGCEKRTDNQWQVNMMFFDNTSVALTPNYFIQQLFMHNAGDYKLESDLAFAGEKPVTAYGSRTLDDIYYVASADQETGDLIVKIINTGRNSRTLNINVALTNVNLKGTAQLTVLQNDKRNETSSIAKGNAVEPQTSVVNGFTDGNKIGVTLKQYSATAIRIRTK